MADRAVADVLDRCHAEDPDVDVNQIDAVELNAGLLATMTGASLFAARSALVIRDVGALPSEVHPALLDLAGHPLPDAAIVLVHPGGQKGRALITNLKKAKPTVIDCQPLKPRELSDFVSHEVRRHRSRIDPDAVAPLLEAVGSDLRTLAAAVEQLIADAAEDHISVALVRRYFAGRAEVTSFKVADAALEGRTTDAMEQLRWTLSTGTAPVLITSAMANGLRGLGKLIDAPGGMNDNDLARDIGVPPWKLKSMRRQIRHWDPPALATAIRAVARADANVKGAAVDPEYALEHCVITVSQLSARR